MSENMRSFESLSEIKPSDVEWLKDGCYRSGGYVHNDRQITYQTKRGVAKSATCFILSSGDIRWRTWSWRNTYEHLSTEEARVFAPEIAAKRDANKKADKLAEKGIERIPAKVGDVFCGSFGYDATLYEFHEVVRVSKTGKTVWTRELKHETAPGYGYNDWKCRPALHDFRGREERHVLQYQPWDEGKPSIKLTSFMTGTLLTDTKVWHDADNYH